MSVTPPATRTSPADNQGAAAANETREWILVTGSSRGIGRAIALRLAREGYNLVLHCRSRRDAAEEVAREISALGGESRILNFDVADREAARSALEADVEAHGCYYGVICNAGIHADNAFPALTDEDWDSVIRTNLDGFYNVVKPLAMPMVRRRKPGRIIVMSSVSGMMGNRGQVNYSAAKAGLIGAVKALAVELAKRRITVNAVAPGVIATEMTEGVEMDEALKMIPMRRAGEAEEVAATVAFLCSKDAGYITRQTIAVNGGMF
ncbi:MULTISPECIES: 3-oxoacyl-ACP reductase FabG [Cobetia]|uniref:3-oxoacyl-ACP reductase FabG n=1 Tax=Cobetia TaxID=204286 RepID=UPI000987882D|nr:MULTISPECIES: 3-oxoacyl-ACP reductase FabG [Cobetia]